MFKDITSFRLLTLAIVLAVSIYLLQILGRILSLFSDIIIVLLLSWLVSFIFEPLVEKLKKFGLSRTVSAITVYGVFTVFFVYLLIITIPLLVSQINSLIQTLPFYLSQSASWRTGWANKVVDLFMSTLTNSLSIISSLAGFAFYLIFILMLSFYLVLDKDKIWQGFLKFTPQKYQDEAMFLKNVIDKSFANFLRAQFVFGLIFGLFVSGFLFVAAPQFSLLTSFLSGFLMMLPLIGPVFALIPPFVVFLPLGWSNVLWFTLILFIFQQILLNIFGPKIIGATTKLSPLWVLIAFLLGFKIGGVWGSIFAVPVASALGILISELAPHFLNHIGTKAD